MPETESMKDVLADALAHSGLRSTRQREEVFNVLMRHRDHPTADEVFVRARAEMPSISLATVYNCLETLVGCGLVRSVHVDREPTRYCANLSRHAHFVDTGSGRVFDINLPEPLLSQLQALLPEGFRADMIELSFRGVAPVGGERLNLHDHADHHHGHDHAHSHQDRRRA